MSRRKSSVFTNLAATEEAFGPPLIGALLRVPWEAVQRHMLERLHESGFDDATVARLNALARVGSTHAERMPNQPYAAGAPGCIAAAPGIALINSIGNLGGFVGPSVIGFLHGLTGSYTGGLLALTAALVVEVLLVLAIRLPPAPRLGTLLPNTTRDP